ncbi:unnamed protein product [Parnassius apollo]|uniref:(apollo) hypothetical protein n=1 Tax=Parnassius apollo TaxID=110799 RepID=A0A8S3XFI3_PARAO|nr:unnamed protein product [Parnassius apollo]
MNNSRSKLLVDIANSRNNVLCVSEAQNLINYIAEANEDTPTYTEKDVSMDLENRHLEVSIDERQAAEAHSDDLNYIIDTVGEISNVEIENYDLTTPICEDETPQSIPENCGSTPMPSPCVSFGDTVNECNYLSEKNYRKLNCGLNLKLTSGRKKKEQEPKLDKLFNNPIPITEVKYKDLVSLCDTMIIPKKYHDFYKNLKHSKEDT